MGRRVGKIAAGKKERTRSFEVVDERTFRVYEEGELLLTRVDRSAKNLFTPDELRNLRLRIENASWATKVECAKDAA